MTTINCSSNCVYQEDGKCNLDNITILSISSTSDCVFFQENTLKQTQKVSAN
ncbi:MAG: hydroxymyristoyl-ACP dehydratase [Clostridia bacterium]|nr:hydroxymyristoyl-ACP dehydratase [Clostridia bacterium]